MATLKSLAQLKTAGGILSLNPVMKTGTWSHKGDDGEDVEDTFEIGVVRMSFSDMTDLHNDKDREKVALSLSKSVMLADEKGKMVFITYEDAKRLDVGLATAILALVRDVSLNGEKPKNSPPPTNSSANSSSTALAATPSQKQEIA